jgi:hypothetical protein
VKMNMICSAAMLSLDLMTRHCYVKITLESRPTLKPTY